MLLKKFNDFKTIVSTVENGDDFGMIALFLTVLLSLLY